MQTEKREEERTAAHAEALLTSAIEAGLRDQFDEPSTQARARAIGLLNSLASCGVRASSLDVAVGIDGVIEVTAVRGNRWVVTDIEPGGERMRLMVFELPARDVLLADRDATEVEVVEAFARAA